jgi:hypothetical protein
MVDEKKIKRFVNSVMLRIAADRETKKRMEKDIVSVVRNKTFDSGTSDLAKILGSPAEFARNYLDEVRNAYPKARYVGGSGLRMRSGFEFTSKTAFKGIPLVQINTKPFGIAKGVIAIGNVAVGVIAIGGISIGVVSAGGISLALSLAMGGIATSLWVAVGGLAVALYTAIGGLAIAYDIAIGGAAMANNYSLGGFASARVAVGGEARGFIAIYQQKGIGEHLLRLPATGHQIVGFIVSKTGDISGVFEWIIRLLF